MTTPLLYESALRDAIARQHGQRHPERKVLALIEVKGDDGVVRPDQQVGHEAAGRVAAAVPAHVLVAVWRPADRDQVFEFLIGPPA